MLYLIGLGLGDLTLNGLATAKKCNKIYLETYTSIGATKKQLEKLIGKKIIEANREMIEQKAEQILKEAKTKKTALLVHGDPLCATTHTDIILRARELGIRTEIIHNASIISAIGETGLQLYKFGKTASIPFPQKGFFPKTPYNILTQNQSIHAHTLVLLDIGMTVPEGIEYLLKLDNGEGKFTQETLCVAVMGLGLKGGKIKAGKAKELLNTKGKLPHCLVIPSKMHFMEEEYLSDNRKRE